MNEKVVCFYWTLPVPWVGFVKLAPDIEEASKQSKTIRYQRQLLKDHVEIHGYEIVHEEIFLEIEPDRGSDLILAPLKKVEVICRQEKALLLFVEFADVQGWRGHAPMHGWAAQTNIDIEPVSARAIALDGKLFDPYAHFRRWRHQQDRWSAGKADRAQEARKYAKELKGKGLSFGEIAHYFNNERIRSRSGRPWTGESLRKLLTTPEKQCSLPDRTPKTLDLRE